MATTAVNEAVFVNWAVSPARLDRLWAAGWRHFGPCFFSYATAESDGVMQHVQPLRLPLANYQPSRSQRRVLRQNADLELRVQPTVLDAERHRLFAAHKARFRENIPDSLENFLGPLPAFVPCENVEVGLYAGGRLVAASFLDLGATAASSIYAIFDPAESRRSLGLCTMLWEIDHARRHGCQHYYPGYAYHEPSPYDYKKRLAGLEWYDWQGNWRPLTETGGTIPES